MLRKTVSMFGALIAIFAIFATSSTAFAAPTTSPADLLSSMQKNCAVTDVQLRGTQAPIITCASIQLPKQQLAVNPNTNEPGFCSTGETMVIFQTSGAQTCFFGTGYMGVNIAKVIKVSLTANVSVGWFLWYYNGSAGNNCTLLGQHASYTFPTHGIPSVLVTQVDPGVNSHSFNC